MAYLEWLKEHFRPAKGRKPGRVMLMIAAYKELGMEQLEKDTRRVLALNEANGSLIDDPREVGEKSFSRQVWEFFELDEN